MGLLARLRSHALDPLLAMSRSALPKSDRWPGPPTGRYLLPDDLTAHPEVEYQGIYPAGRIVWSNLGLEPSEEEEIRQASERDDWTNQIRAGFVARIANGRFVGQGHTLVTPGDAFYGASQFPHQAFPARASEHAWVRHPRQGRPQTFQGRGLLLMGFANLYHFLFEAVARLCLARAAGCDPRSFDWYISDAPTLPFQHEYLDYLGIDRSRFLPPGPEAHYRFGELIFSNATYGLSPQLLQLLRSELGGLARKTHPHAHCRKVYLSRGTRYATRRIVNEGELIDQLKARGYEVVHPHELNVGQQRALFEDADEIISSHGACLAHLIWCRPGTRVIELRAQSHVHGYWKLYWNLSSVLGLQHRWVSCPAVPNTSQSGSQYADLVAPLPKVGTVLDASLPSAGEQSPLAG